MLEVKENFFRGANPEPVTMPLIRFMNDPEYRVAAGMWVYERFNSLTAEYQKHGRFLTLQEIQ